MSEPLDGSLNAEQLSTDVGEERGVPDGRALERNILLKVCIFATGLAGIVAEYVMSTLASYLLGNAVLQWTLTVSLMLFAMGVGSRVSRVIKGSLLDTFVFVELVLSVLCAASAVAIYTLSAFTDGIGFIIYLWAFAIGVLIGIEIPLVARLNEFFEELRVNISNVLEKDYYGALVGGLLFAFVGLPYLGLTHTPIILGAVNFSVAMLLFYRYRTVFVWRRALTAGGVAVAILLVLLAYFGGPITLFGEQQKYRDKVVLQQQTRFQRIVMTRWKTHHWLYLNGNIQFSSYDEERYHEPLVHPAMLAAASVKRVLVLGGGDGLAVREILKHDAVESITLVDLDPAMIELARAHPVITELSQGALEDPRVSVLNADAFVFMKDAEELWDVIIVDLPDPKTVGLARLYSIQFYRLASKRLSMGGVLVTQAGSPFFSHMAYLSMLKTMGAAGLRAVPYHNHVPTMGEWGWVLGMKTPETYSAEDVKERLSVLSFDGLTTRFINQEAMLGMLSFGKGLLEPMDSVEVSDEFNYAVYYYYRDGRWDLY